MHKPLFFNVLFLVFVAIFCSELHSQGEWLPAPSLQTPRTNAVAVPLNGKIYVIGGAANRDLVLNTVEIFDPDSNRWFDSRVEPLRTARHSASAIVFNNQIFVLGGIDGEGNILDEVEAYDPLSNTWSEKKKLLHKRKGHFSVILNNQICVFGGQDEKNDFIPKIEWYQNYEDSWVEADDELYAQRIWPFFADHNNEVYIFGGFNPFPVVANLKGTVSPEWFFSWESLEPLQKGRGYGATAILGNKVFLMGGETLFSVYKDTTDIVEFYDLSTGKIESAPPLLSPRLGATAVTLNDTIYLIGGIGKQSTDPLALVETYTELVVGISDANPSTIPETFAQITGYPNPFNGTINLEVAIPRQSINEISIYNLQGQKIKSLYKGRLHAGKHTFRWHGDDNFNHAVSSGLYFAILKANSYTEKFKVIYIK